MSTWFIRFRTIASGFLVLLLGLGTKFYDGLAVDWVQNHLGGTFYEIFWCLALFQVLPSKNPSWIVLSVFLATSLVELSQLSQDPLLLWIRSRFLGRILVGTHFDWLDFPHYAVGSLLGWIWIRRLRPPGNLERTASLCNTNT